MNKVLVAAFAGSLALAGCASVAPPPTPKPIPAPTPKPVTTVSDIQEAVVSACRFMPAVSTIVAIMSTSKTVLTATQIAELICSAVNSKSAHKGGYAPKYVVVNNKVILLNGEFVK